MRILKKRVGLAAVLFFGLLGTGMASALATPQNFSFTGTFNQDDDVQLFNFTVGSDSTVTLRTWSYAGGTNAAGQAIAEGGFDPILALFDGSGTYINQNDDGGCGNVPSDSITTACFDTYFSAVLAAGNYTAAVMEYNNFANGPTLADGFERDGQGDFTGSSGFGWCSAAAFCDVTNHARTNAWAFDILNVDSASTPPVGVPEPSGLALMGGGLVLLFWLGRRRWQRD